MSNEKEEQRKNAKNMYEFLFSAGIIKRPEFKIGKRMRFRIYVLYYHGYLELDSETFPCFRSPQELFSNESDFRISAFTLVI